MGKIDIPTRTESRQRSICSVQQSVCGKVIHGSEPFAFEYTPQCLGNVEVRAVWWKKEQEQTSLLPDRAKLFHQLASVYACIVKHYKGVLVYAQRQSVKKVSDFISCHIFRCGKSIVSVVSVNHTEDIKSDSSFGWDMDVFSTELPAIGDVAFCADVTFIPVVEINESGPSLTFEFLQLLGLILIELRRGFPLGTFSYTSISRANADKKALNVLSLASLPDACCHDSLALATLCRSFSIASRTDSSSVQSIMGLRPRPGRVSRPLMPSASNRLTHELTDMCVISVWSPTCSEVRPVDFRRTARQRIRYAWLLPWRKPSSNCRRCWSVSCITLIFAIVVMVRVHTNNGRTLTKILI